MPKRVVPSKEILQDLYDTGMSAREIADHLKLNRNTVASALGRLGVINRTIIETKALQKKRGVKYKSARYWLGKKQPPEMVEKRVSKIRGDKHYLWKGGASRRAYRNKIEKRECASCKAVSNLGIHHIDFDHFNNSPENLRVLCVSCHMSLHKQAYWDAIHAGKEPPKSNAPTGWKRPND